MIEVQAPTPGVPWYIHPAEDPLAWQRLLGGRLGLGFAVLNVHNGPGAGPDEPYYGPALADGIATPAAGYVDVAYGARTTEEVLLDARRWRAWYGIHAVMLDCVPTAERQGHWALEVVDRLRDDGATWVAANPGAVPSGRLVQSADVTCVVEQEWSVYRDLDLPAWLTGLPPERQWHLVHGVPAEHLADVPAIAAQRGAWFSWATDRAGENPWDRLPVPYRESA